MTHYIEIRLNPEKEMPLSMLLNTIYSKFHHALYDLKAIDIGVSFPKAHITLGNTIRIHSSEKRLQELEQMNWMGNFKVFCGISSIKRVPENACYQFVSRKQQTKSNSGLERYIRRNNPTTAQIKDYKLKMLKSGLDNPYVELMSNTNHQRYRVYFRLSEKYEHPKEGSFNYFGLSKTATVPWF